MKAPAVFQNLTLLLAASLGLSATSSLRAEENWPQFRGIHGTGHSEATGLPVTWDAGAVAWKATVKGIGQSSVVNWGDKLFLTSAKADGSLRWIHCLDRLTGKLLWEREVAVTTSETPHQMNSFATASCATDGERVIAFFGPGGLHCFDLDGNPQWQRQVGDFPGPWGVAASPIIDGELVIQNCDAEGPSSLVALNKKTGEPVWTTPRKDSPRGGWSTPIVIDTGERRELILNGEFGVNAYDPATGTDLWFCEGFTGRGAPTPDFAHGLLYVVNGKPGNNYVVKPGGSGDVTKTHRVWDARRQGGRDLPSPAVVGDYLLISSMSGILTTYDAKTGEIYFTERLNAPVSGAPLVIEGLVYFQMENGEVIVVRPGKTLDIVARNTFGADPSEEIFRAALSPIQGQLFTRSQSVVYCIGK
ncbi:MAG: PQQ-binding-like beta-propeller repeat protein [Verrucomicrobiae bacterium]|nr:PQQ-binding-like beta-propeller repeat protein [Verrucomicrobiae bacterium]